MNASDSNGIIPAMPYRPDAHGVARLELVGPPGDDGDVVDEGAVG